jgi:hypothetical protein
MQWIKRQGREAAHSPPTNVEVKKTSHASLENNLEKTI